MDKYLKPAFFSLIPALILSLGFGFLISLLRGMNKINDDLIIWKFIGFGFFMFLFVQKNNGYNIFGRFLRYAAYECWLSPLCVIFYTVVSMSQVKELSSAGAAGVGFGGIILVFVFGIGGGLLGLVLYLISNAIIKNKIDNVGNFHNTNTLIVTPNESTASLKADKITILKYMGILAGVGILFFGIFNRQEKIEHVTTVASSISGNSSSLKGYTLTAKENDILSHILKGYALYFSAGNDEFLKTNMTLVSASEVAQAYNENQVAADQKYFKKMLFLSGKIEGIQSGLGNEPYISLNGLNPFLPPQAHFKNGNIQKIATLRKNQDINLVCTGGGAVIGVPMFKDCVFAIDFAEKRINEIRLEIEDYLHGEKPKSKDIALTALMAITVARILPETWSCAETDEGKCLLEILGTNREFREKKKFEVVDELHALGVQIARA